MAEIFIPSLYLVERFHPFSDFAANRPAVADKRRRVASNPVIWRWTLRVLSLVAARLQAALASAGHDPLEVDGGIAGGLRR